MNAECGRSSLRSVDAQRIAIIGGGAIGGVLADAAQRAGHRVTLCARTPFDRLTLETPEGTGTVPVSVVTEPERAPDADWVVLTTKVQDVPGAQPWLRRFDGSSLVLVQNGVEHRESVAGMGLSSPLLPAMIYVIAERVRPGHVVRRSSGRMVVPDDELGRGFAELVGSDELVVQRTADFRTDAWRKMLVNAAANPVTALTLRRLDVLGDPEVTELAESVLQETLAVARAEGADLRQGDVDEVLDGYRAGMSAEAGTSMLYDRLAGSSTEHDHITGAIVHSGLKHGIPTPLNRTILTLMRSLGSLPRT